MTQNTEREGYQRGDSAEFVTPPPTYEGELNSGEQANADFVDQLEDTELLEELQDGGHVIYFRHAQTERDFADQVTADVNDYSTQRVLSEFGVQQSLVIGEGFELSQIPYDDVITSDYGRSVTTAAIAFGEYQKDSALNFLPFEDYTDAQIKEMRANVTPFLTAVPEDGTNTIVVGHDDLFEAGTGIYPDPQGIAYVLTPDGNGEFEIIANLLPEEWAALSGETDGSEETPMPDNGTGGGASPGESREGWTPGDSFDFVTPPPTYEGELNPGEQVNADFVDQLEGEELLEELQDGGYVIYFRHTQTERDFADQVTADVNDYSTQRVLSEFGVQQSLVIGEGFERSEIPYDEVITSDYGRSVTTAAIAFGEYQKDSALNFLPFEDYTDAQIEEMRANVTPFLSAEPEDGTNTIIVGHDDLFEAGTGIYPDPQGIAYVLDPDGNGDFEIVANLLPEEWVELSEFTQPVDIATFNFDWTGQIAGFSIEGNFSYDASLIYTDGIVREEDLTDFDVSFFDPDGTLLHTYEDNHLTFDEFNFAFDTNTQEILQDGFFLGPDGINIGEKIPVGDGFSGFNFWSRPEFNSQGEVPPPHLHFDDWADEFGFPIGFSSHEDVAFLTRTTQELLDTGRVGETYIDNTRAGLDELGERVQISETDTPSDSSDLMSGTSGDDLLPTITPDFDGSNDLIFAGAGNDEVDTALAGDGNNRIDLGSGDDLIFVADRDRAFGSTGNDEFDATDATRYRVSGGLGDDTFFLGSNGRALGGDGEDRFYVGLGGDNLIAGGEGADQFWVVNGEAPTAANTIVDFELGVDVIGISGLGGLSFSDLTLTSVGNNTEIAIDGTVVAQVLGTTTLEESNFAFVA